MTMEVLADWVSRISNVVWNGLLLYLLVGTGIIFTIRTRHSDRCRHGFAARPTVVSGLPRDT